MYDVQSSNSKTLWKWKLVHYINIQEVEGESTLWWQKNCHKYGFLKLYDFELQPSQYWKEIHKLYSE
jgi:hypothetical protein